MVANELFSIITDYYRNDKKAVIENINEIIHILKTDTKRFIIALENKIEDFALEGEPVCPKCGSELEIINVWEEDRGEYFGAYCSESSSQIGCSECSFIIE